METINFDNIALNENELVLDLGCGEGRHSIGAFFKNTQLRVIYVDLSHKDILKTQQHFHDFFGDISYPQTLGIQACGITLPFAPASFDHIICSEVLEHVPNYQGMLHEIHRVLKPGGTLSISVPRRWPEKICWALSKEYYNVPGGHIRIFDSKKLQKEIVNLSFNLHKKHWQHSLHVPYWWLKCAFWKNGDNFLLTRWYHKFLVWDLLQKPKFTQILNTILNPIMGKSVVFYFSKRGKNA